jgi:hypothetical protein
MVPHQIRDELFIINEAWEAIARIHIPVGQPILCHEKTRKSILFPVISSSL